MKTFYPKPSDIERDWYLVNADGKTLGRLAAGVARLLKGKHKTYYTPHLDCGDFVVIVNAEKIRVTGKKLDEKFYYHHSGYPGGIKKIGLRDQLDKHPDRVLKAAVWGMLPKGRLGRKIFKKLKVYGKAEHPHRAQKLKALEV
ncbi:MAG: 50S ribosomal protein L13 [Chloroflexi bacterium]|nr:50S ribosomal protein L13 [Chloroflexota bacterium]MBI3742548.1 50S ribosomal protein L13 [Chloroflexota bacterium]